jgi:hypothetical protein
LGFIFSDMMKNILVAFSLLFVVFSTQAQVKTQLPCLDKKFSVVVHIVKDSLGQAGVAEADIVANIASVSAYFSKICVSFEVCEFRYIDNFLYDQSTISRSDYWSHVQQIYNVQNRINIYYVTDVSTAAAGIADLGAICNMSSGGIRINKKSVTSKRVLVHEMGHYFGLEHTFVENRTTELVDGSNALTTADGIADTPADPYIPADLLLMGTYIDFDKDKYCQFIYKTMPYAVDANGQFYNPLVGNIMSYYPESCDCGFTDGQYHKMAETYMSNPKMW